MNHFKTPALRHGDVIKLARLSGLHQSTVARILRGDIADPGISTAKKLTAAITKFTAMRKVAKPAKKTAAR